MFICSVRAGTLKFFGAVLLALALFLTVLVLAEPGAVGAVGATPDALEVVNYSGIRTDEVTFLLPEEFDRVLAGYNEIQKAQGLDLGRYKTKRVTRYTYEIANYEGYEGKVYANLIMYKNKIVAADITSADPYGFVHGLKK